MQTSGARKAASRAATPMGHREASRVVLSARHLNRPLAMAEEMSAPHGHRFLSQPERLSITSCRRTSGGGSTLIEPQTQVDARCYRLSG